MTAAMNDQMHAAQAELKELLERHRLTAGMYVRIHGDHLVVGRREAVDPHSLPLKDDRVRLTRLNGSTFGLSVRRHTGRWQRTPFAGGMVEMVNAILSFMQHLVAPSGGVPEL
jgi:hypothetical protein